MLGWYMIIFGNQRVYGILHCMMEQIKGVILEDIRSFLNYAELMNSKIGPMVLFGLIYLRLSFIET